MANEIIATQTETAAPKIVIVPAPEPGQMQTVELEAGQIPQLGFDPGTQSTQEFVGDDLVFTLDNGAVLTFVDFAAEINNGEVASIMLADGSIIPLDLLMEARNPEVPETAAGASTANGGHSDDVLTGSDGDNYLNGGIGHDTLSFADLLASGPSGLNDDLLSFAGAIKVSVSDDGHDLILTVPDQVNTNTDTTITLANLGGDYHVDANTTLADLMNLDLAHHVNVDTYAS
jgi:hypothetical protein